MIRTAFAFDLDGTITQEELLPVMAIQLNLEHEMRTLTKLTLSGAIPFDDSFRLRCAILRAVPISTVQQIVSQVALAPETSAFIQNNRDTCFVVTGNLDLWIAPIIDRLGCRSFSSTGLPDGDHLIGVAEVLDKSEAIPHIRRRFDRVVAIGDSVNDIPMFYESDISVACGNVHEPAVGLQQISDYVTYDERSLCRLLNTLS